MAQESKSEQKKKTKPQLMEEFCKYMKILSGDLKRRFPTDQICNTIHRKIIVSVDHAPERILRAVGVHLVKYNDKIMAEDYDFFLKSTFATDFPDDRQLDEKERLCLYTIDLVKQHWNNLNEKEKGDYRDVVLKLLFCYTDFREIELKEKVSK